MPASNQKAISCASAGSTIRKIKQRRKKDRALARQIKYILLDATPKTDSVLRNDHMVTVAPFDAFFARLSHL